MAQVDVNLRDIYRVVRKRKWIIILAPILMGISTYILSDVPPPIYTSDALVKINRVATVAGMMTEMVRYSSYDNMATQIMVISSRPVLEKVAQRLNMVKEGEDTESAFENLQPRVAAEQKSASDILAIRATAPSAHEAITLANTLVDVYIEKDKTERTQKINDAVAELTRRSAEVTEDLNETQRALFDFKRQERYALALNPNRALELEQKAAEYRLKIENHRSVRDSVTRIKEGKEYEALLQAYFPIDDSLARSMLDEANRRTTAWVDARNKRNSEAGFQLDTAPKVVVADAAVRAAEERLNTQLVTLAGRLNDVVAENQTFLDKTLKEHESVGRQPELATQLDELTLNARQKQEEANTIRKQLADFQIQQKQAVDEITIVERAHTALTVLQPQRRYRALVGVLIGILIGGVFSFILEAMDTSLGTIEDVEQHINSVVLGIIPHLEKEDVKDRMKLDRRPVFSSEDMERFARLVTHFDPKSIGSEAYRTLRTNVASIAAKTGGKVLMVSSSMIKEGKTTSCTNLATAFAQSGKRTLLIDADLRRPAIDKIFGIVRSPGLTDLLLDTRDPRECFRTIDDIMLGKYGLNVAQSTPGLEYLTILPAGHIVDKPTELLTSPALDLLLDDVRTKFDIIILDASPVLPVADAYVLAPKVDGVVLTYQIGRVARDVLRRTKLRIEGVGGKVWGVILNDIQSAIDYRSGDFSYYHYRYDRHRDEPKTPFDRIKEALKRRPSRRVKKEQKSKRKPPEPPSGAGGSGGAQNIMSLTDDR